MRRAYSGARPASGMNAAAAIIRRIPGLRAFAVIVAVARHARSPLPDRGSLLRRARRDREVYQRASPSPAGVKARPMVVAMRSALASATVRLDIEQPFEVCSQPAPMGVASDETRRRSEAEDPPPHRRTLRARGYPPSVREIAVAVGLSSTSAVHHHLQMLEREGYLERGAAQSRAIRLTPTAAIELGLTHELVPQAVTSEAHVLPVIGEIAAGGPIEAYQDASETMAVPDLLAPSGDAYVLKVRGDSMIEEHIADGDFVLIRPQSTARATATSSSPRSRRTRSRSSDSSRRRTASDCSPRIPLPPQFYDDVRIQGKLIGVIRRLD